MRIDEGVCALSYGACRLDDAATRLKWVIAREMAVQRPRHVVRGRRIGGFGWYELFLTNGINGECMQRVYAGING